MIISNDQLNEFSLLATDGSIGHVKDLYIDDESWAVRYLVVETGNWFTRHRVLIPTAGLGSIDSTAKVIQVSITRDQVQRSPDVDCDMPVSRQHETDLSGYYGFPSYLEGEKRPSDPHLRSAAALTGYAVRSDHDEIGHVKQFLMDEDGWRVVAVIVKTGTWWHGDLMRIATAGITTVDWDTRSLEVTASRESLKDEPQHKV